MQRKYDIDEQVKEINEWNERKEHYSIKLSKWLVERGLILADNTGNDPNNSLIPEAQDIKPLKNNRELMNMHFDSNESTAHTSELLNSQNYAEGVFN